MEENKEILKIIGNNIKEARTQRNYTQENLAEKLKVSDKFISLIERGASGTSISKLVYICRVLNVEPNTLFKGVFDYNDNVDKDIIDKLSILTKDDKDFLNNVINYILNKGSK